MLVQVQLTRQGQEHAVMAVQMEPESALAHLVLGRYGFILLTFVRPFRRYICDLTSCWSLLIGG